MPSPLTEKDDPSARETLGLENIAAFEVEMGYQLASARLTSDTGEDLVEMVLYREDNDHYCAVAVSPLTLATPKSRESLVSTVKYVLGRSGACILTKEQHRNRDCEVPVASP